jgi:hypothetical protein
MAILIMYPELTSDHAVLQEVLNQNFAARYGSCANGWGQDPTEVSEMWSDLITVDSGSNLNASVLDMTLASTYPQEVVPQDENHHAQLFESQNQHL